MYTKIDYFDSKYPQIHKSIPEAVYNILVNPVLSPSTLLTNEKKNKNKNCPKKENVLHGLRMKTAMSNI